MSTTRLEAIMFTDIAGYSRLMDEDEDRTIELLKRHNDLVFPLIDSAGGEVIDAIGDGLLVVFPSVRNAVECAVSVHDAVAGHNEGVEEPNRFFLRIGVHIGEVVHDGERVFGTGVNVAARVQPFALPGGICVTEDVVRHVERRIPQSITSIGVQELKNISRKYELFRIETGHEQGASSPGASDPATVEAAKPFGELDRIKERILQEIGKASEGRIVAGGSPEGDRLEQKIESKVYGLVERVMDHALDRWEEMPDEKKRELIRSGKVAIAVGKEREKKKDDDDDSSPSKIAGQIVFGAAAGTGFGLGYFMFDKGWMIWPFVILGALPVVSGFYKLLKHSVQTRAERSRRPAELEREVLQVSRRLGGRVTVVQLAAETGHSLDEIQHTLDTMTSKGYVSQEILDTGVIRYDFPSLLGDDGEQI